MKREHIIILAIMVTEVMGFSLILPFLPYYAQEFGASAFEVGLLLASFSLFQFFSAPILGKISDRYGRRPLLLLSQFSTALSFVVLGFANSLWVIFLSRIIDGVFGSNGTIARAYLSDTSTKEDRSKIFGYMGAAFGAGFMVGPALGGYLSQFGYHVPAFAATGFSVLTMILTYLYLPETVNTKFENGKLSFEGIGREIFDAKQFLSYLKIQAIRTRLIIFFAFVLSHGIFVSSFAIYADRQIGLDASQVAYLFAYIGFVVVIMRMGIFQKLLNVFSEQQLLKFGIISMALALFIASFVTGYWQLFVTSTLYAVGNSFIRPLISSGISRALSEKEQGAGLGVTDSLNSLSQIIGPAIGGFLLSNFFPGVIGLVSAAVLISGTGAAVFRLAAKNKRQLRQ